jgi:hypothetical protein
VQNTLAGTIEGFRVGPNGELTLVETENEGLPVFAESPVMDLGGHRSGGRPSMFAPLLSWRE